MLRGFRKPYKKLFDGEVFTTVRITSILSMEMRKVLKREDVIALYPRSKRYLRLGRAIVVSYQEYHSIDSFAQFCSEEFAQYDAQLTKEQWIDSLRKQAKGRKLEFPRVIVYTYLWTEKEDGYYEAKEGMQ